VVLSSLYRDGVERSFDRRLDVYLKTLVAEVSAPDDIEKLPQSLSEPLFDLPLSGWYWQTTKLTGAKPEVKSSRSLWDAGLPHLEDLHVPIGPDGTRKRYVAGPRISGCALSSARRSRRRRPLPGRSRRATRRRSRTRRSPLIVRLSSRSGAGDRAAAHHHVPGALRLAPLKRISASLAAIRAGTAERLEGRFPEEIAPLARETNALIDANREIVERARTHVGNLAHALKTPLSVIVNEAAARSDDPLAAKVREQAAVMRDQVQHHLERARIAARATVVGTVTEVAPVVTALARSMEKITATAASRSTSRRAGDEIPRREAGPRRDGRQPGRQCLQVGAVARRRARCCRARESAAPAPLRVVVDDDGPGLNPRSANASRSPRRGNRLDETKPGTGLGLSS
jgi:signal transduction histidine kinase